MNKSRGFTLVELLVVIAIIALLMAILMPTLNRVKKQAKSAACKMNLHQWGLIWGIYCDGNDGKFCTDSGGGGWPRGKWIVALRSEYQTKSDILRCPIAVNPPIDTGGIENHGGPFNSYYMGKTGGVVIEDECSYGANCWIYAPLPGQTEIQNRPTKWNWVRPNVRGTNYIPVFADSMWRGGGPTSGHPSEVRTGLGAERSNPPADDGQWDGAKHEMKHFCINRHHEKINMLFMDWSQRSVDLKELWTLKWHRNFNTRGPWTRAGNVLPREWPLWMRGFKDY